MASIYKLDFIVVEKFLAQNPQLTEEERREIFALDHDAQNPLSVKDQSGLISSADFTDRGQHVLDVSELKDAFKKSGIDYSNLVHPGPVRDTRTGHLIITIRKPGWYLHHNLARYALHHLNQNRLAEIIEPEGFPIAKGSVLGKPGEPIPDGLSLPQYNLHLYMSDLHEKLSSTLSSEELEAALEGGPVDFVPQIIFTEGGEVKGRAFTLTLNGNSLFWQMIDPENAEPELTLKFARALEKANLFFCGKLMNRLSDHEVIRGADFFVPFDLAVSFDDLDEWFRYFLEILSQPLPEGIQLTSIPTSRETLLQAGWELKGDRGDFEDFINSDLFKRVALKESKPWPPTIIQEFLSFFDPLVEAHRSLEPLGRYLDNFTTVDNVLEANGYVPQKLSDGTILILRIIESANARQDIFKNKKLDRVISYPDFVPLNLEPLHSSDAGKLSKDLVDGMEWKDIPLVPFLCRRGLSKYIVGTCPWLKEAMALLGDDRDEAMAEFSKKAYLSFLIFTNPVFDGGWPVLNGEKAIAIFLSALKESNNPRAGLVFLAWLASYDNELGRQLKEWLPFLFSEIEYDYLELEANKKHRVSYFGEEEPQSGDTIVESEPKTLGNAWAKWDDKTLPKIGIRLAEIGDEDLRRIIKDITFDYYEYRKKLIDRYWLVERIKSNQPVDSASMRLKAPGKAVKKIPLQKLIQHLKLESTREKVLLTDPVGGGREAELDRLIQLELTGGEREDLRRGLKKVLGGPLTWYVNVNGVGYPGSLQLELLSPRALEILIINGHHGYRADLWQALFRKGEKRALHLYRKILKRYKVEKHPALKDDLFLAFPYLLSSRDPLVKEILEKERGYLVEEIGLDATAIDLKLGNLSVLTAALQSLSKSQFVPSVFAKSMYDHLLLLAELGHLLDLYRGLYLHLEFPPLEEYFGNLLPKRYLDILKLKYEADSISGGDTDDIIREVLKDIGECISQGTGIMIREDGLSLVDKALFLAFEVIKKNHPLPDDTLLDEYLSVLGRRLEYELFSSVQMTPLIDKSIGLAKENNRFIPRGLTVAHLLLHEDSLLPEEIEEEWIAPEPETNRIFFEVDIHSIAPLLSLQNEGNGRSARLIRFFERLQRKYQPLKWASHPEVDPGQSYKYLPDFKLAECFLENSFPFISKEDVELLSKLIYNPADLATTETAFELVKILRRKFKEGRIEYGELETKEELENILFPEKDFKGSLLRLNRFDQMDYPRDVLDRDISGMTSGEVMEFQNKIKNSYGDFLRQLSIMIFYRKMGIDIVIDADELAQFLPAEENRSPWLNYVFLLLHAANGYEGALDELWRYETEAKKMESEIGVFQKICDRLLKVGRQILMVESPERFEWGQKGLSLRDETLMGMVEMAPPSLHLPDIARHWDNPQEPQITDDPESVDHASFVIQTLISHRGEAKGTVSQGTVSRQAHGLVRSYNLDETKENHWKRFDQILEEATKDVEEGHDIAVVNISIASYGLEVKSDDFEKFRTSELVLNIQKNIAYLKKKKIPVVVAGGNEGMIAGQIREEDSMAFLNLLGVIDSSIILVASTTMGVDPSFRQSDRRREDPFGNFIDDEGEFGQIHISPFSSPGNTQVRPDISAIGEGYNFWGDIQIHQGISGTSFSAPVVARLIAKMKELNPRLSVEMIQAILKASASDLPGAIPEEEGGGKINPNSALYLASVIGKHFSKDKRGSLAVQLGLQENHQDLDFLARRLQGQVFFTDTTRQSFGE